ncbi:LysM peptidoglycan-binding domain-containing protein [Marinomonas sp.]|uniref:LysM peptidoglycan-binding domain-containing protein n=1 Tax=Marinomonas sp. TaxID=1904862 RepID=UPI003A920D5D
MKNYIIEAGDTISAIAKANGISKKKLLAANQSISDANDIKVGDQLSIPEKVEDPATQDALSQSNSKTDGAVEECPLQAEWLTIKPLCYAVAEDDSEINLAEDLTLNSNLPALTQHKYITRLLSDQVVYLYHPEEKYLLQVVYADGKGQGKCLFGEPTQEIVSALPLLKQPKDSKVIMWLTQAPLTQARIDLLQANPDLIEKAGQMIDFAKAAKGQQEETFPLFDVKKYLAELAPNVTSLLDWSANPLETSTDENTFIGDCQSATPDNNYGVCLVDAIGITTDLCREFSIAYEIVMSNMATVQHPFQMAKLTRALINREANKANKATEMDEGRLRVLFGAFPPPELTQSLIVSRFSDEKKNRIFEEKRVEHEESFQQYLNDYKKDVAAQAEKNAQEKKSELEELIHKDKMDALLDKQPNAAKEQKEILEGLAEDWVSWIKDSKGSLDLALTWLDDADEKQLLLKETLVAASINNINTFDKGVAIVAEWVDSLSTQLSEEDTSATINGVGAHYFITMGFGTVVLTGSKWLKAINGLVSSVRTEIEKAHEALMFKMRATPPTEVLLDTISAHLVKMGTTTPEGQALWKKTFDNMSRRYGMQFATVTAKLDDVAFDLKASYAAVSAVTFNQALREEARSVVRSSTKMVNLIDLEQAGAPGDPFIRDQAKYPRFLAKHMNALEVYGKNSKNLKMVYAKSDKIFSSARQTKLVGIFAFAQLFNTIKLYDAMEQDTSFKAKADFYSALFGLSTASMALVDKVFSKSFAGQSFTGYMKTTGAMAVGNRTTALLHKARPFEVFGTSDAKQMTAYKKMGSAAGKFVNGAFRALPVLGALVATFSSSVKLWDDVGKQNTTTVTLSALSVVANAGSAFFFIVGFLFSGPVLIVLATALGILAIALDFWRGMVADDQAKLLLKSSYWGKSDYKYQENISSWEDRSQLFNGDASEEEQKKIVKTMGLELRAFCDYLYKPVAQVVEQTKVGALSVFTIIIELPNFVKGKSDVTFAISGDSSYTPDGVLLASNSEDNRWQMNNLKGGLTIENNTGLLTLEIDERTLTSHREKRIQTGQASRNNSTKGMNYMKYNLSLEYKQPAGIPINLKYPKITIDDNKFALSFWRNQTEIEDFYLEQAAL